MHRRFAIALLALLLTAGCVGGGTNPAPPQPAPIQNDEQTQAPADDEAEPGDGETGGDDGGDAEASEDGGTVTARPAAELEGKCTREPQPGTDGEELIAELEVVNTGNIGINIRVSSQWPTGKIGGITRWSRVRVEQGETRPLTLRLPIATETADDVRDGMEAGRRCRLRQRITGAFGAPE